MSIERQSRSPGGFPGRDDAAPHARRPRAAGSVLADVAVALVWFAVVAAIWFVAAMALGDPIRLPGPVAAFEATRSSPGGGGIAAAFLASAAALGVAIAAGGVAGAALGAAFGAAAAGRRAAAILFDILGRTPLVVFAPMAMLIGGIGEAMVYRTLVAGAALVFAPVGFHLRSDGGAALRAWQNGVFNVFCLLIVLEMLAGRSGLGAVLTQGVSLFQPAKGVAAMAGCFVLLALALLPGVIVRRRA